MRNPTIPVLAGALFMAGLVACAPGRDVTVQTFCSPGVKASCPCDVGTGEQFCADDGSDYGACNCSSSQTDAGHTDAGPTDGGPTDGGSFFCSPNATETCTCPDNRSGNATCNSSGTGWGACVCESQTACTVSSLVGNGSVTYSGGSINYSSTAVDATFTHYLGAAAAGCVGVAHLVLSLDSDTCRLTLDFGAVESGFGGLTQASLIVDPLCAQQTGLTQGTYAGASGYGLVPLNLSTSVPDSFTTAFCLQSEFVSFGSGSISLTSSGGGSLNISLGTLSLLGNLYSTGSSAAACYSTAMCGPDYRAVGASWCKPVFCGTGQHDGGDGTCVANGSCSSGYHNGGDGTCVFAGSCLSGYHDGGDGSCQPNGSCTAGYHDGGGGLCVVAGSCSSGYHDGGSGACVTSGTCSSGYALSNQGTCIPTGSCSAAPAVADAGFDRNASVGAMVVLDGSNSVGAAPLSYSWSFTALPSNSQAFLATSTSQAFFTPDVAGTYQVKLTVTDGRSCTSAPTFVTVSAVVRPPSIVTRVTWDSTKGDVDLHYLAPGGFFKSSTLDCYYANPTPNWGPNMTSDTTTGDDPTFGGAQPTGQSADQQWGGSIGESVAHPKASVTPALFDGVFLPEVHFFCDHQSGGASQGSITATIHVLVDDNEVFSQSRTLTQGPVWPAAQITVFGSGTSVTVAASGFSLSTQTGCQ